MVAGNNDLSGNSDYAVFHTNPGVLVNASGNWWGSALVGDIGGMVSANVDFTPWLGVGTDTSGSVGFQGSFSVLHVDDDSPQVGAVGRIQEGVNLVTASTVNVGPGTYEEQVVISTNNLTLDGAGIGVTIVRSPVTLTASYTTSNVNKPIVFVSGATGVTIRDLTVDGFGRGNSNYRFQGIAYWNAGGTIDDCRVTGVRDTPFSGAQHGVAIASFNNGGGPYSLNVTDTVMDDFQKNGMALSGNNMTVDVERCVTTGVGPTTVTAQNGIQVSFGAGGVVRDCSISNIDYTPASWVASGLLAYQGGSLDVSGLNGSNVISNVQAPVSWYDTNGSMDGIEVSGGAQFDAIFVYNSTTSKAAAADHPEALPFGEMHGTLPKVMSSMSVDVSNSYLDGSDAAGTSGIYVLSNGGPLGVDVQNCSITDWTYGLVADGAAVSLDAYENYIESNVTAGYYNDDAAPQDAEFNWWGHASGPSGVGPGTGDAVLGSNVDFSPWRTNGTDADPLCGFQPSDNTVAPATPGTCISTVDPCVTVPFNIARADATPIRGFSVMLTLSSELMLCAGTSSITEGSYLSAIGGTNFQVVDNGGGSYTVDCAILGIPCGATASSGTLFNVAVKNSGGDGTGTLAVAFVTLRDCNNVPVPGAPGVPATITIDNTPPAAITLAAVQDKTGNGSDGTTFIDVSVPAVAATDLVRVYSKGFGNYPEYDDPPSAGSAPSVPATEAAAIAAGWSLAFTLGGPAGLVVPHEPLTRDFWYFVAFVQDACGNVGPAATITAGTLNYHLGDVAAGCAGNNLVDTADISFLGFNYGITLGAPPQALACLDVGPTTNYSVNARPTTDNLVQFEDLMMFAINYGGVSKGSAKPVAEPLDALTVETKPGGPGEVIARLILQGSGRIQGLSTRLSWNESAVRPVGMTPGELVESNGGAAFAPLPGAVDAAVLGTSEAGFTGHGVLATVTFRVIGAGEPEIGVGSIDARDSENARVDLNVVGVVPSAVPSVTELLPAMPNPFNPLTTLGYRLSKAGQVEVAIYAVDGRRVKVLEEAVKAAGAYRAVWDGTDESGRRVASGQYFARLRTAEVVHTRALTLLK